MDSPKHFLSDGFSHNVPSHFVKAVQPFLMKRFDFGPSFYFIYDYRNDTYLYVEKRAEHILLYQASELLQEGQEFFLSRMHPEDLLQHREAMRRWQAFFRQQSRQERQYYSTSFDFRFRKGNGQYLRLLQQLVYMEADDDGEPLYSLEKCTNISHWQKDNNMVLSIIGPGQQKNLIYHPSDHIKANDDVPFTATEIKILRLISQGKTSRQTADLLNISHNTVNTHRRNMRRKMGVGSTTSLIRIARDLGLFGDD